MLSKPLAAAMVLVVTATALWVGWEYGHRKGYELGMITAGANGGGKGMIFHDPTDPPIIVHGGSMHLNTVSPTNPQSGATLSVATSNITTVQLGGYDDATGKPAPSPISFTTNWEVDACNDAKCRNGLKLCSATDCNITTNLPANPAGTVTIASSAGDDKVLHFDFPQQFSGDWRYRLRASGATDYHPAFVMVKTGTSSSTYTCGPAGSTPADWGVCWIAAGSGY